MVSSGDRSAKIRTYNYPQGRVTEHRISLTKYNLQNVIGGDIQQRVVIQLDHLRRHWPGREKDIVLRAVVLRVDIDVQIV